MTHQEIKELIAFVFDCEGVSNVNVKIKQVRRGYADWKQLCIVLPQWAFEQGDAYITYYAIHEASHIITRTHEHNEIFKTCERKWLANYGLQPVYSRAYVKGLTDLNGVIVWARRGRKRDTLCAGDQINSIGCLEI